MTFEEMRDAFILWGIHIECLDHVFCARHVDEDFAIYADTLDALHQKVLIEYAEILPVYGGWS